MGDMKPRLSYYGEGKESMIRFQVTEKINAGDIIELDVLASTVRKARPVEPERVKGRCVYSYCSHKSDGPNWCAGCEYWVSGSFPSPGLLQRMGMATWVEDEKAWAVFFQPMLMTWAEAVEFAGQYESAKVFRWQDGLR